MNLSPPRAPRYDVVALGLTISSTYRATPQTHGAIAEVEPRGRP